MDRETIRVIRTIDYKPGMSFDEIEALALNMERTPALEQDPNYLQLVAYFTVGWSTETLLVYQRVKDSGEQRLHGKYSIGFGGHVKAGETVLQAVDRELAEELWQPGPIHNITELGVIYEPTSQVGSVHLGLAFHVNMHNLPGRQSFAELTRDPGCRVLGDSFNTEFLTDYDLESWSWILYGLYRNRSGAIYVSGIDGCGVYPRVNCYSVQALPRSS